MAHIKLSRARPTQKPGSTEKRTAFRAGRAGVCEAQLWEFTAPSKLLDEGTEIQIERVAASSLDEALKFMRRRHPDFIVVKVEAGGMIAMLSGSPLD